MKKKIIFTSTIAVFTVCAVIFVNYLLSFKNINFVLDQDVSEIIIYKLNSKIETISNPSKTVRLQTGNYIIEPVGEKISTDKISIQVVENEEIIINPNYSKTYLSSLLNNEETLIMNTLKLKYQTIISEYDLKNGKLFIKGQWYGGLLTNKNSSFNNKKDVFRFVAKKTDDVWEIVNYPDLILTVENYPDVPKEILNEINSIEYNY